LSLRIKNFSRRNLYESIASNGARFLQHLLEAPDFFPEFPFPGVNRKQIKGQQNPDSQISGKKIVQSVHREGSSTRNVRLTFKPFQLGMNGLKVKTPPEKIYQENLKGSQAY
jgi:hypothetical protein